MFIDQARIYLKAGTAVMGLSVTGGKNTFPRAGPPAETVGGAAAFILW